MIPKSQVSLQQDMGAFYGSISLSSHSNENDGMYNNTCTLLRPILASVKHQKWCSPQHHGASAAICDSDFLVLLQTASSSLRREWHAIYHS
jgi:hypothetical protein